MIAFAATSSSISDVEPGVLAFLIVAGMAAGLVFLLFSMNKQFRKITPGPDSSPAEEHKAGTQAPS